MSYTQKQWRVIAWYAAREDAVPQLSSPPTVRFKKKSDGSILEEEMSHLTDWYDAHLEQKARERAAQRREVAKADKQREKSRLARETKTS